MLKSVNRTGSKEYSKDPNARTDTTRHALRRSETVKSISSLHKVNGHRTYEDSLFPNHAKSYAATPMQTIICNLIGKTMLFLGNKKTLRDKAVRERHKKRNIGNKKILNLGRWKDQY